MMRVYLWRFLKSLTNLLVKINESIIYPFLRIPDEPLTVQEKKIIHKAQDNDILHIRNIPYFKIPKIEIADYVSNRQPILLWETLRGQLKGIYEMIVNPYRMDISDINLANVLNNQLLSQMAVQQGKEYVIDLSYYSTFKPFEGTYNAGTIAYLNDDFELIRISVDDNMIYPTSPSWFLAKVFFVCNLSYEVVLHNHGTTHSNTNIISALFNKFVPKSNPIEIIM
jgi:hypothetical protein